MIFRKTNEKLIEITQGNQIIPNKKNTQFLEKTLDNRLNWEEHIGRVRAKAKISLNTIKMVAGKKWGGDCMFFLVKINLVDI